MKVRFLTIPFLFVVLALILTSCSSKDNSAGEGTTAKEEKADPMANKGIGPVQSVTLAAEIDREMAAHGQEVFDQMCTACHKADKKFIGPAMQGIMDRRSPEWIMNMILNPEEMTREDPIAKGLLIAYNGSPMANQNLTEEEARAILEYFRTLEAPAEL